ncbi:phosphatase PAP2 family protein [Corynebacterium hylobatis]|uniref:phosphatase PAP2 family protein n=1 Tax=Corynebacterium hylobatis TaxID=1859290 RepID=UPI0013E0B9B7|nr:phosphatase PAP2 family protein [Corynebacterium hylobatis]
MPLPDSALWHRLIEDRHPLLVDAAVALSAVTRPLAVTALSLVVAALLAWRWRPVLVLPLSVIAAGLVGHALKPVIGRERPPEEFRLVVETNHAMPSGHATGMAALAMVLTLWWWPRGGWWRLPVAGVWVLAVTVSWTRLYLGVHWFSDVLAGLILGGAVAFLVAEATKRLTLS